MSARSHRRTRIRHRRVRGCARGQAMIECVVSVGVLVALFLGVLYIGRLHDLQYSLIQASRYAAFDVALAGSGAEVDATGQAGAHLLGWHAEPVRAGDSLQRVRAADWLPALSDHSGAATFWPNGPALDAAVGEGALPGLAGGEMQAAAAALAPARALAPASFDVRPGGWIVSEFATTLQPGRAAAASLGAALITLRSHTVVAAGDWSASGPAATAARVAGLSPASGPLVRGVVGPMLGLAQFFEPAISGLCLGRVDPEVVPRDRLGFAAGAPRGAWRAPC